MNKAIYNDDDKKIIFTLSMTDGPTQVWKESFLGEKAKKEGGYNLETILNFIMAIQATFAPSDIHRRKC